MPQDIKFGTVTRYPPGGRYGFIRSDDGVKAFFHVNGRGGPDIVVHEYAHHERELRLALVAASTAPVRRGDRMAFLVRSEPKGLTAYTWVFQCIWLRAVREFELQRFRVIRHVAVQRGGNLVGQPAVEISEGTQAELDAQYPTGRDDMLAGISSSKFARSNPKIVTRYSFMRQDGAAWVECKDPRTSKVPSSLTRAS